MRLRRPSPNLRSRRAYVLVVVLIVVVILSLAAYRFTDAMTSEFAAATRTADGAQTKLFAASGVHYAMGLLSDPAAFSGTLNSNPYDNAGVFAAQPLGTAGRRGGARFSLISVGDTYTGSGESRYLQRYGVSDESAKINLNAWIKLDDTGETLYKALLNLPNMTEDVADAIVDWVDADDTPRPAGAETADYAGAQAKNGPINSIDELLLVRGVTPALLYGSDRNRNGVLDAGEEADGDFSRGWSEYLTAYGHELDTTIDGIPRIFLNDAELDAPTLYDQLTQTLPQGLADYVMAVRLWGQTAATTTTTTTTTRTTSTAPTTSSSTTTSVSGTSTGITITVTSSPTPTPPPSTSSAAKTVKGSLSDLNAAVKAAVNADEPPQLKTKVKSVADFFNTRVSLPKPANADKDAPTVQVDSPLMTTESLAEMLPALLEWTTSRDPASDYDMTPRVNVLTAPPEVLMGLPGLTAEEVDAIVQARTSLDPTDPAATTGAFLVTQANLPPDKFNALSAYVTGRTMVYRVHSVGHFANGGPQSRIEAVIDTNGGTPRILSYRDVTDLGRGFEIPTEQ